jgi:formiminoglutamase
LPVVISVPHAGLAVPEEVASISLLTPEQIERDGDVGAKDIYRPLEKKVAAYLTTEVARAFVDLNRAERDIRADGVVKTETCWKVPIYSKPLSPHLIETLLERYHRPYHARLHDLARTLPVRLGIDCHTMAAEAPPISPRPGTPRPRACVSNQKGETCPDEWARAFAKALEARLGSPVTVNDPFLGGYITKSRPGNIPWLQLELSRAPFATNEEKSSAVCGSILELCSTTD